MISLTFRSFLFSLLFLSVVVPNSLQLWNATMLIACYAISLLFSSPLKQVPRLMWAYFSTIAVTIVFILVGIENGAPWEAAKQILIVYVISPFLWITVSCAMLQHLNEEKIARWFVALTLASIASVGLYFYLFLTSGPAAVSFFIEDANLNIEDGFSGATMFVYGSLTFLTSGFFAASSIVKNPLLRASLLAGVTIVAITSGRSALILSIPIGLFLGTFFRPISYFPNGQKRPKIKRFLSSPLFYFMTSSVVCLFFAARVGVDVELILSMFTDKVSSGGGSERTSQFTALLQGVYDTFGIGAGHGIGVSLIRNGEYPWRYENVWLATLFRVGVVGALIYAIPFIIYLKTYVYLKRNQVLGIFDLFLFSGFCSAFAASITNPYIEAFSFQWMFVIPMVSLALKRRAFKKSSTLLKVPIARSLSFEKI